MFDLYKSLMTERENDGTRLWVLFGLMNVINGALLAAVLSSKVEHEAVNSIVSVVGLVVSLLWWAATRRMSAWIGWWEEKLVELESHAFKTARERGELIPENFTVFVGRKLHSNIGLPTKWVSQALPIIFFLAWALILITRQ